MTIKLLKGDYKIFLDLKEKFYESGLIDKLKNFTFGQVYNINDFNLQSGFPSGEYIEWIEYMGCFYSFKNLELEDLKIEFCENYLKCMNMLLINYFPTAKNTMILNTTGDIIKKKKKEFDEHRKNTIDAFEKLLKFYQNSPK